jgi:cadmium resistance protein CadD (predicted permease)
MNVFRGIILFGLGVFAIYKGWTLHTGQRAWLAYGLGLVAIGLGVWRLLRREDKRLV